MSKGEILPIVRSYTNSNGVKLSDQIFLSSENPDQTAQNYQARKNIFWMSFIDYSMNHPELLSGYMTEFIQNEKAPIFNMFPIKVTQQTRISQNRIVIEPQPAEIGTRKVPNRQISIKVERREGSAVYTGQGFSVDYHHLRTPDGMAFFDRMANAVVSDIWCMIAYSTIKEFQSNVSQYVNPDQLFPYDEAPTTPDDLFKYEATQHGALNKNPQAIHNMCARVGRIFEANNGTTLNRMLLTMDCSNFINVRDKTNLFYDKSGSQALTNRSAGNVIRQVHGLEVIPIEIMANDLHSANHDLILQNEVVTGGMFTFPEKCQQLPARRYKSHFRNVRASSWTGNKMEEYGFRDRLHHRPEFYSLTVLKESGVADDKKGQLHSDLLKALIDNGVNEYNQARVKLDMDYLKKLHPFIYNESNKGGGVMVDVISMFGEIEEYHLKTRYLTFVYQTMEYAISKILSESEKQVIGEVFARNGAIVDAEQLSVLNKFKRAIKQVYEVGNGDVDTRLDKCVFVDKIPENGDPFDYLLRTYIEELMYTTRENSLFKERMLATNDMPPLCKIAARLVLTQTINLQIIDAWTDNDIAIPLGAIAMRPFESQFMESMIFVSSGNVGNLYFSGLDNIISFDPDSQHFNTQVFGSFKPFISDPTKFYVAANTRGLQILGGKGNKYINAREDGVTIHSYGTERFKEIIDNSFGSGERLGDYSIIPVLTGYNYAIEDQFKTRHLDARGYWDPNDFVSRLHHSDEFVSERFLPMYPNQFLTNMIYPFHNMTLPALPTTKASFDQLQSRRRVNTHIHQITQDVYNPLTDTWDEIVSSAPWGRERDGIVQIQNSTAGVSL